MTKLFQFN